MTLPALLFGFLLSSAFGAAFHLWRGGNAGRLMLDLFLSWTGFSAGQVLGDFLGLSFARLGPLHLGLATIGSLVFLFVGHWLSQTPQGK